MRILQVAYTSVISGGEKVLFDLATSLVERGHEVRAVCPSAGPLPEALLGRSIESEIIPFRKTYDLRAARRLSRFIRQEKIEILHSHGMLTNIIARLAGHWAGVPGSVSTEHLTMELARGGRGAKRLERWKARYYRFLDNYTSRYNQAVVAVSGAVKDDLVEQGMEERKVTVIQNGIRAVDYDPRAARRVREELGVADNTAVVGTVGRLSPQKDYPTLLRAAERILEVFPDALFLIAGAGDLRRDLESMVDSLGIKSRVRFLGYCDNIMEVISAFDLFVLSSLWEGLPLAVLEAMALRKPVVATAVPGTREAVVDGETGYLVPLGDAGALARRIIDLLNDREGASEMGEAGRRRVLRHFSVERMVDEYEALYRKLR